MGEFDLIGENFANVGAQRSDVLLGVGDDAALVLPPAGQEMVIAVDTLVEGQHFPPGFDAKDIGWRSLAVNLSDCAAMGAQPLYATLALTIPEHQEEWLADFAEGFASLAKIHGVSLIGGDTTRGPLTITVQIIGVVPRNQAMRRSQAKPGDLIYVTGWPGDAAAGLALLQGRLEGQGAMRSTLEDKFKRPEPRVAFGQRLRQVSQCCIDVSDGLVQDLGHICTQSQVGATLRFKELPMSRSLHALASAEQSLQWVLGGGDDYELLFTIDPKQAAEFARVRSFNGAPACHCIGEITAKAGVRLMDGKREMPLPQGWDPFRVG
jgi:thiamine-monophosphate kinase